MARNGTQFNDSHFEKKLLNLKDTQESIQNLSAWCLSHKSDLHHIIKCWTRAFKKGKTDLYLPLFYLANDIIQHSKKKGNHEVVTAWEPALKESTPLVSEDRVIERIKRIFKIWEEREIYSSCFLKELLTLLTTPADGETKIVNKQLDFETSTLIEKIHNCNSLEGYTDAKQKLLNESKVKITELDSLRNHVKEKHKTNDFFPEFDASVARMEEYVRALEAEIGERASLVKLLEQGDAFYENQKGEFKQVFTAYKQFGSRVKAVKRKLEEMIPTLTKAPITEVLPLNGNKQSLLLSAASDLKIPDPFATYHNNPTQKHEAVKSTGGLDLDSRITSFLAGGQNGVPGSFLGTHFADGIPSFNSVPGRHAESFQPVQQYQQGSDSFFDKTIMTSVLGAPPPPPPPPPLGIHSIPIMPDLTTTDVPFHRQHEQLVVPQRNHWESLKSAHHPLSNRIPSWEGPLANDVNDANQIAAHAGDSFFSGGADQRSGKRPIDHRNLISLTGGPEKCSPKATDSYDVKKPVIGEEEISSWLKVLRAQEEKELSTSDLNKQVSSLLDSFDSSSNKRTSSKNKDIKDGSSSTRYSDDRDSKHGRTSSSSRSHSGSRDSSSKRSEGIPKTPTLKSAVVFPDDAYSSRGTEKRKYDREHHSSRTRKDSHSEVRRESASYSSSSKRDSRESSSRYSRSSHQKSSSRW